MWRRNSSRSKKNLQADPHEKMPLLSGAMHVKSLLPIISAQRILEQINDLINWDQYLALCVTGKIVVLLFLCQQILKRYPNNFKIERTLQYG